MADNFLPNRDADLIAWGENFNTVASSHLTELGLTATQLGAFAPLVSTLRTDRSAADTKRAQAAAATLTKNNSRAAMQQSARALNLKIQALPTVSAALKRELRLTVKSPASRRPPVTPENLTVNGYQNGVNALRWNRSGNCPGTMFDIEARIGDATAFVPVITITAVRYDHAGQTPGVPVVYRVRARRAEGASPFSNTATVYEAAPQAGLTLLKAA